MSAYVKSPGLKLWADDKNPPEPIRLHLDWWGQCRTCEYWQGPRTRRTEYGEGLGVCASRASAHYAKETAQDSRCAQWDSYDYEAACAILDDEKAHA